MATIKGTQYNDRITLTDAYSINGSTKKQLGASNNSTNYADNISGGNGSDYIDAAGGNDIVSGGNGKDTIYGGAGNDTIYGDDKNNLDTTENGADNLYGDAGDDVIYGGNGADIITGGLDDDVLVGGNGPDTFIYKTVANSEYLLGAPGTFTPGTPWDKVWDFITDFQPGTDKINLGAIPLTGSGAPSKLDWIDTETTDANAGLPDPSRAYKVWADDTNSFIYADTNGDGIADVKIQVENAGEGDLIGVNQSAVFTSGATSSIAENSPIATVAYNADATDPNGDTLIYSLSSGGDNDLFDINGTTGVVTFKASPNFEAPGDAGTNNVYDIVVHVSDGVNETTKAVAITVTDVNEQPAAPADFAVNAAENVNDTTVLATVTGTDPDLGGGNDDQQLRGPELLDYRRNGAGLFEINSATGAISLVAGESLDYEDGQQHVLTVTVSDGPGLSDTVDVTINVTDVNEAAGCAGRFCGERGGECQRHDGSGDGDRDRPGSWRRQRRPTTSRT